MSIKTLLDDEIPKANVDTVNLNMSLKHRNTKS